MWWIVLLLLSTTHALGVERYVACETGSDSANGLTSGTAWRTPAKSNTSSVAGDTIRLRRGETCTLTCTVCGSACCADPGFVMKDNQTLTDYGAGALPRLLGPNNSALRDFGHAVVNAVNKVDGHGAKHRFCRRIGPQYMVSSL